MRSGEYRDIIRKITKTVLNKKLPGVPPRVKEEIANIIAVAVHARMYGANVDGVDSPLWRISGEYTEPNIDAATLMKEVEQ